MDVRTALGKVSVKALPRKPGMVATVGLCATSRALRHGSSERVVGGCAAASGLRVDPIHLACYASVLGDQDEAKARLATAFALDSKLRTIAIDDPDLEEIFGGV